MLLSQAASAPINTTPTSMEGGAAVTVQPDWRARAACRDEDAELFFPVSEHGAANTAQITRAKRVCAACPVAAACRADAAAAGQQFGIWGGLTPSERRALRQQVAS